MKKFSVFVAAALAAVIFAGCAPTGAEPGGGDDPFSDAYFSPVEQDEKQPEGENAVGTGGEPGQADFRVAVWVSYLDLSAMLARGDAEEGLRAICDNMASIGATDLFLQVRAFGDALYPSEIYPDAFEVTYKGLEKPPFDILKRAVELCNERGIALHAWVNPYRLWKAGLEEVEKKFTEIVEKDPTSVIEYQGDCFLDPGCAAAREMIVSGVVELLRGYDLAGVHFDDYFYPTDDPNFDAGRYEVDGGGLTLAEWRRGNVSRLMTDTFAAVKAVDQDAVFGVSPDGSIERNREQHYADVELWCSQEGYIDYICPQLYYGFLNESMPFGDTAEQWAGICTAVDCLAGLAFYKVGQGDRWAGSGEGEWLDSADVIARQCAFIRQDGRFDGVALYRYDSLFNPDDEAALAAMAELDGLKKELY